MRELAVGSRVRIRSGGNLHHGAKPGDVGVVKSVSFGGCMIEGPPSWEPQVLGFFHDSVEEITDTLSRATSDESSPTPTLRDQFAMAAMQGLDAKRLTTQARVTAAAMGCYVMADAMLKARDITPSELAKVVTHD